MSGGAGLGVGNKSPKKLGLRHPGASPKDALSLRPIHLRTSAWGKGGGRKGGGRKDVGVARDVSNECRWSTRQGKKHRGEGTRGEWHESESEDDDDVLARVQRTPFR